MDTVTILDFALDCQQFKVCESPSFFHLGSCYVSCTDGRIGGKVTVDIEKIHEMLCTILEILYLKRIIIGDIFGRITVILP